MNSGRIILVCGLPGAGKTTLATQVERSLPAFRLCTDEWMTALAIHGKDSDARSRIERLQWQLAQGMALAGHAVVLEYGFWTRSERGVTTPAVGATT